MSSGFPSDFFLASSEVLPNPKLGVPHRLSLASVGHKWLWDSHLR